MIALALREVRRAWTGGGIALTIAFFLLVAILFPFAIGPDQALLARTGGGIAWTAALLAALLPVERLIGPDVEAGVLDQLVVRGWSETTIAVAKIAGHWWGFAPSLMVAAVPAGALLGLDGTALLRTELALLVGSPGLAALAVATAALIGGLRGAGAIAGLVLLPFAVPLLIFGVGASEGSAGALKLLGATSLFLLAGAPVVAGAALRFGRR